MVRDMKEKEENPFGGETLLAAGTPHNNYMAHIAVHLRWGGRIEGFRGEATANLQQKISENGRNIWETIWNSPYFLLIMMFYALKPAVM